jgi:23S rRNA (pseudouridine1915-N3)-methyltransferase
MKLKCWSIGKAHDPYVKAGIDDFTKRIGKYFVIEWTIVAPPKNAGLLSEAELKKKEAEIILSMLGKDDQLIILDENGKMLDSPGLAILIQQKANESSKTLVFLIGGAYGVDSTILSRANFKWSLSRLVFPHQLVRLILSEQLYRACTILRNEKYHHS